MKPVMQTKFGDPDGNCFASCLASLLELPLESVPDFQEKDWWGAFKRWLKKRGLAPINLYGGKGYILPRDTLCIAGGKGPRGLEHSVIWKTGGHGVAKMVHDPHPSGEGLVGKPRDLTFLVSFDPAKPVWTDYPKEDPAERLYLGSRKGCQYFPCHEESKLEDCTYCFCPFYPCKRPIVRVSG